MKITLMTLGALVGALLVGLALVPVLFKDQIVERLRSELNDRIEATVTFSEIDLSLLSTFPNLTAEVSDLAITGKDEFAETTLFSAASMGAGVNLVALVLDGAIEIESLELEEPAVHVLMGKDGKANYDIVPEGSDETAASNEPLTFEVKRYRISDGSVAYHAPSVHVLASGLQHDGRATISGATQQLSSQTTVDELTARVAGVTYLKKAKASVALDATLETDREQLIVRSLEAAVNQLALEGEGTIGWASEGTELDLRLASKNALPVKALISAIPNAYAADFAGLKASGAFSIAAKVRGELGPDDDDIPSFSARIEVRDAALKYPDLPLGITDLNFEAKATHPGGALDRARFDVPKYSIAAGKSHAKGHLSVTRPISQPNVDLLLDGRFDLAEIAKAYPIPDVEALEGLIAANIDLEAKGERVAKLTGDISITNLVYRSAEAPEVRIRTAQIALSPESTKLAALEAQVGESDLSVSGLLSPLTTLLMDDQKVTASAWIKSKQLRVEDFLSTEEPAANEEAGAFLLPDNIDAKLQLDVAKLTYGDLLLSDFQGQGRLQNRTLILERARANGLGGSMKLEGKVTTPVDKAATFDVTYVVDNARFADAFEALPSMRAYAPIARFLEGRFSTDLNASGTLGEDLSPVLDSVAAGGLVAALQSKLRSDFKPLTALNEAVPAIPKPLDIEGFRSRFQVENGAVKMMPFTVNARGLTMQVSGTHGLDQEMKYQVSTDVPLDKLSSKLKKEAQGLKLDLSKANAVGVRATLTGSISAPRISVDLDTKALRGAVADAVSAELAAQKARAVQALAEQTERLIEEAEKRADQVRGEGSRAAEIARKEGYARAAQLEREAGGNPLKAAAAKEGAKRLRNETDKRANQLIAEANKRADQVVDEARKRAAQMEREAAKRSDQATGAVQKETDRGR